MKEHTQKSQFAVNQVCAHNRGKVYSWGIDINVFMILYLHQTPYKNKNFSFFVNKISMTIAKFLSYFFFR
jgi:hypothetical protein